MNGFPDRVTATFNRRMGLFSIKALDGPRRGRIVDHYELAYLGGRISYPKSNREGPYAPISGTWLPTPAGGRVRLSVTEGSGEPVVEHLPEDDDEAEGA